MHRVRIPWRIPLVVLTLLVLDGSDGLAAEGPYDARVRGLVSEFERNAAKPEGVVPLLELWRISPWSTPDRVRGALDQMIASRRAPAPRRALAGYVRATELLSTGDVQGARDAFDALGYVTRWRFIGGFDNEGKLGFDAELGPEKERLAPLATDRTYPGKERTIAWRDYSHAAVLPFIDFGAFFRPQKNVCGYAETFVRFERAEARSLWFGGAGAIKVWWNGELIKADPVYRGPFPDRWGVGVKANAGWNRVLVKSCTAEGRWGFFLRVGDRVGGAAGSVEADASENRTVDGTALAVAATGVSSDFAELEARASVARPQPADLETFANVLDRTRSEDPSSPQAKDLAERSAKAKGTVDRWLLAARLARARGERMRFAKEAQKLAPKDPRVALLLARIASSGPRPEDALPWLDKVPARSVQGIHAGLLRARVLEGLQLNEAALAEVARVEALTGPVQALLEDKLRALDRAGRTDDAIETRQALLGVEYEDAAARRALIDDALRRKDRDAALRELDALRTLEGTSTATLLYLARTYRSLDRNDDAAQMYVAARTVAPEDADVYVAEARFLMEQRQTDAARDSLLRARTLRPQDPTIRELLERVAPSVRADENYAVATKEILGRRRGSRDYPSTRLVDLTVHTVYASGLGSEFHQVAAEINNDEGARAWRTFSIPYEPERQRVDVRVARVHRKNGRVLEAVNTFERQLGEPWYRIYYDRRAMVVALPTLEPGDVVELRYRVDDTTRQNFLNDYFGDTQFFQSTEPLVEIDYILVAPKDRTFYMHKPALKGLTYTQETQGDLQVHRFGARDVPAVHPEPDMPGFTEVAPYLHISTYRTWEDVGRWWWGLIQDQLQPDERIKAAVRELVKGAKGTEEKVQRIYDWVLTNTRYVGLEFGVHGFKPYRVSLVVQRGFGDCKDKASLLYVMLKEAGIDARIVLLRTRRNGDISTDPASLAVFDHAIAYVPELDRFLDGTAENSGSTELPEMDQGAMVLIVGPKDVKLSHAPVLPPETNERARAVDVKLAADGAGELKGREVVRGTAASAFRARFEAPGTRQDRTEQLLRDAFSGFQIASQSFASLADRESEVAFEYAGKVPNFATADGATLRVPTSVLHDLAVRDARSATRRYPLALGATTLYRETRTVSLPSGYKIAQRPDAVTLKSKYGSFELSVEGDARNVKARTVFSVGVDRVSPAEYPAFREWLASIDRKLKQPIVLTKEAP